jgi:hypothetical protein
MKVVSRSSKIPPTPSGVQLREAIKTVATFTFAPDDEIQPAGTVITTADAFREALSKDFFEHIFVARPEYDDIYNSIGADRPILIEGLGGCGKTTMLLALRRRLSPESRRVAYLNAKSRRAELDREPARLWEFAYDQVMNDIFRELPQAARQAWQITKLRQHEAFRALRDQILTNENPNNDAELLALLNGKYLGPWLTQDQQFRPSQEAFRLLLMHLTSWGTVVCVMLDGLDAVALPTLRQIVAALFALSSDVQARWTPIIALRTSSWRQLSVPDPGAMIADRHQLRPDDFKKLRAGGSQHYVGTSHDVVRNFLLKRLQYVAQQFSPASGPHQDELQNFRTHLQSFDRCLTETGLAHFMAEWHNGSLRGCGVAIISMLETLLSDADPVDCVAAIIRQIDSVDFDLFALRSFVYRHLTISHSSSGLELAVPNVAFERTHQDSPFVLHFPVLHFLEYLANSGNQGIKLSAVERALAPFGFDPQTILRVLECTVSPDSAPGMVLLDRQPEWDRGRLACVHPDTEVEILPRGHQFAMRLTSSCEYLFWSALDAAARGVYSNKKLKSSLSTNMVADPLFRANLAIDVLAQRILPSLREELNAQREPHRYGDTFRDPRRGELYGVRAAHGVLAFLRNLGGQREVDQNQCDRLRSLTERLLSDATSMYQRALS